MDNAFVCIVFPVDTVATLGTTGAVVDPKTIGPLAKLVDATIPSAPAITVASNRFFLITMLGFYLRTIMIAAFALLASF
jgi:hypothetical protein